MELNPNNQEFRFALELGSWQQVINAFCVTVNRTYPKWSPGIPD